MEEILPVASHCSFCDTEMQPEQFYCEQCGFPERKTEFEKSRFHAKRVRKKQWTQEASGKIRSGRISLFVVAAISLLTGIFYFYRYEDNATLIASAILAIIYLGLGFWSQQRPLIALILGLLVFVTTIVINGLFEPETIYKGIILKIFIIAYLGKGINSALQLRNSE
ncbi:hypothetical protein [Constantimarinum furrinae]|uniref:hypothetical protein n=1 Tax=Constantimarinum furrinae TaxID=2562285 RepID=UPI00164A160C|nr:hypothetical protein [Constantimarinum furrinae]